MKVKNKKTIIAIIAVLLVVVVGATFAYFNSSAIFENQFNLGNYNMVTQEVFTSPSNWSPGDTTPKTITARNNGMINAAVRIKYEEAWTDSNGDEINNIPSDAVLINFITPSKWIYNSNDGYYYYKYYLKPGEETITLIESVTLNPNLNESNCIEENGTTTCTSNAQGLSGATYTLTFTIETVQYDKYKTIWNDDINIIEKLENVVTILKGEKGALQPGDEVGIGDTEDFYVISSDNGSNGKTLLLSKYNLLVGNIVENDQIVGQLNERTTPGYGLQSIDATAGYAFSSSYGSTIFANTNYWISNGNLSNDYSNNGQIYYDSNMSGDYETYFKYVYDDSYAYPYVYDENSNLYQYISGPNGYVNKLIEIGAPSIITGRLLSYEEANELQEVEDEDGVSIIFDGHNDYWLGSASNKNNIYSVVNEYGFLFAFKIDNYQSDFGVRPVIEIPTSAIG